MAAARMAKSLARARRRGAPAAVLLCLSILIASCGSDSKSSTTATTAPATSPTTSVAQPAPAATTPQATATTPQATATTPQATAVDGTWTGTYSPSDGGSAAFKMQLKQSGDRFSGPIQITGSNCVSTGTVTGTVSGSAINFGAVKASQSISYTGTVKGNSMSGTYTAPGCGGATGSWKARR